MSTAKKYRDNTSLGDRSLRSKRSVRATTEVVTEASAENSFLNTIIEPILSLKVAPYISNLLLTHKSKGRLNFCIGDTIEVDAERNLDRLEATAINYARIHGKELKYHRRSNPIESLSWLYLAIKSVAPDSSIITVDWSNKDKEFVFVEYRPVDYQSNTIFALPVSFVECISGNKRDTVLSFLHMLIAIEGFSMPKDHYDMSFCLGEWGDEPIEEEDENYFSFVERYLNGDIRELMRDIISAPFDVNDPLFYSRLSLWSQSSETKEERAIFSLMREYMDKFSSKTCRDYDLTPESSELGFFDADTQDYIVHERLNLVVYSHCDVDPISEKAIDILCEEANCLGQEDQYDHRILTPDTSDPMEFVDYPARWAEWFEHFIQACTEYEQNIRSIGRSSGTEDGRDCLSGQSTSRLVS